MPLSLQSFRKELPDSLIQKAEKLKARDLDTLPSGGIVAFVEEGKPDFDVSLELDAKGEILASSCDCSEPMAFCQHKVTLLIHIEKERAHSQAPRKPRASRKVLTPAEAKLEDISDAELRNWLIKQFKKRKDLEFEFLQTFSARQNQFTYDEVSALSQEVIQSVVKSKTKVKMEMSEIRKILSLWKNVHLPVLEFYLENPREHNHYMALEALLTSVIAFDWRIRNNTNKFELYEIEILEKAGKRLSQIMTPEVWEEALMHFVRFVQENPRSLLNPLYRHFFFKLSLTETGERKAFLVKMLMAISP